MVPVPTFEKLRFRFNKAKSYGSYGSGSTPLKNIIVDPQLHHIKARIPIQMIPETLQTIKFGVALKSFLLLPRPSVADPICLVRISDPSFSIPDPRSDFYPYI